MIEIYMAGAFVLWVFQREFIRPVREIITVTAVKNCNLESVGIMLIESADLLNVLYGNYC